MSLESGSWQKIFQNSDEPSEPEPRYAHQLVYDDVNEVQYLFGGNPGEQGSKRLDDFWELRLYRPKPEEIVRKATSVPEEEMEETYRTFAYLPTAWGIKTRVRHPLGEKLYHAGQYCLKLYEVLKPLTQPSVYHQCMSPLWQGPDSWTQVSLPGTAKIADKLMEDLAGYLPEYMIISRICHKNPDAFAVLRRIIVNVVLAFSDQAIWQMMSVSRSVVPKRKRVCNMILDNVHHQTTIGQAITEQIKEALDLCDNLIALCMTLVPGKVDKLSMEKHFSKVYPQLRQHFNVTIPGQQTRLGDRHGANRMET
ncbi:hypothetical protein BGZ65_004099 [Modicella reniformis]|uniref:Serine/threonine-protein kinase ATR-like HEAT repeats domain-containing protein n=1 Tax=Modicella reniformis TaxID=1440133 RepID=A0A9P6SQ12_9FUNG|nr:hypothetical protein BGZ65_004099 [Modicella reniformis]